MEFNFLYRQLKLQLNAASPELILNRAAAQGIVLKNIEIKEPYCAELIIDSRNLKAFEEICLKSGGEYRVTALLGAGKLRSRLKKRRGLIIVLSMLIILLYISSLFIWDVRIRASGPVNESEIKTALERCGLSCGSFRPGLKREEIKNRMLALFPDISFLALNIEGSRAELLVSPAEKSPEIYDESSYKNILASHSGIIKHMDVFAGLPLVKPGDAVEKAQLLISGEIPSLNAEPRKIQAKGRVIAETLREFEALSPSQSLIKGEQQRKIIRFALKFGRKRQNLYFYTGKHIDECVKIIKEYNLGIDGLFSLPVSLIKEELRVYELKPGPGLSQAELRQILLKKTSGLNVLETEFSFTEEDGLLRGKLKARCLEDIGIAVCP